VRFSRSESRHVGPSCPHGGVRGASPPYPPGFSRHRAGVRWPCGNTDFRARNRGRSDARHRTPEPCLRKPRGAAASFSGTRPGASGSHGQTSRQGRDPHILRKSRFWKGKTRSRHTHYGGLIAVRIGGEQGTAARRSLARSRSRIPSPRRGQEPRATLAALTSPLAPTQSHRLPCRTSTPLKPTPWPPEGLESIRRDPGEPPCATAGSSSPSPFASSCPPCPYCLVRTVSDVPLAWGIRPHRGNQGAISDAACPKAQRCRRCLGSQFKWNRLTRFCVRLLPDLFWPPACPANG